MRKPTLVIVSGLPATGKTVLSHKLAKNVGLPLFSKDTIKEILFDGVGHGDRAWGEKLNTPTYDLLDYIVEQELAAHHSLIIETPYDADFRAAKYIKLQDKYGFNCMQILCYASPDILVQRFISRIGSPDRHPGHNDQAALEDFKASIQGVGRVAPLPMAGKVHEIDTTDFTLIDEEKLFDEVKGMVIPSTIFNLQHLLNNRKHQLGVKQPTR